jgi:hypothetical protein
MIDRLRHALSEMDYAQRRLFELRTGVPTLAAHERSAPRGPAHVAQLEALYALPAREDADDTPSR